jgi:hypothetical protein
MANDGLRVRLPSARTRLSPLAIYFEQSVCPATAKRLNVNFAAKRPVFVWEQDIASKPIWHASLIQNVAVRFTGLSLDESKLRPFQ